VSITPVVLPPNPPEGGLRIDLFFKASLPTGRQALGGLGVKKYGAGGGKNVNQMLISC